MSKLNVESFNMDHTKVAAPYVRLAATEVPACNEVQCGWAVNHSLEGAKELAENMLAKKDEWHQVYKEEA